ncbi:MAG: hypothetical protein ABIO71_13085 [Caldimonas sp.]
MTLVHRLHRLAARASLLGALACVATPAQAADDIRYTCCNLRHEKNWISDDSFTGRPFLPVGARVVVKDWGRNKVFTEIEGIKVGAGPDEGYFKGTREQFAGVLFVSDDPKLRIATFTPAIQAAIRAGRVSIGMTQEQALMALGPARFDVRQPWTYFADADSEYDLEWNVDGTLREIHAPSRVRLQVEFKP